MAHRRGLSATEVKKKFVKNQKQLTWIPVALTLSLHLRVYYTDSAPSYLDISMNNRQFLRTQYYITSSFKFEKRVGALWRFNQRC
jgi:hypothetical protein